MRRIAALPMYPAAGAEPTEAFWRAVAERLISGGLEGVPDALDWTRPVLELWGDEGLLLGQSCGWPLLTLFPDRLRAIAAPVYAVPGCQGASHCAFFVVHRDSPARSLADLRGARFAMNASHSNTGMNLPRHAIAPSSEGKPFFAEVLTLGSHAAAFEAVATREADAASIDCVSYAHFKRVQPGLAAAIRVLAATAPSPSLPFVTSVRTDEHTVAMLCQALAATAASGAFRDTLFLDRMVPATTSDYRVLLDYAEEAARLGYPELA